MQPIALQAMAIARIGYCKLVHRSYGKLPQVTHCKLLQTLPLQAAIASYCGVSYSVPDYRTTAITSYFIAGP